MTRLSLGRVSRFVVSLGAAIALGAVAAGCSDPEPGPSATVTDVLAPDEVTAGSTIEVVIEGEGEGDVALDVIDAFAVTTFTAELSDGRATVTLPATLASTSGLVTFVGRGVQHGSKDGVVTATMIVPDVAATAVDISVGPRTVIADGVDQTMVVAIANDAFGNPLLDGEQLVISLVEESGPGAEVTATIDHGLVGKLIEADTLAGGVEVFATATSGASSRRVGFDEVPGAASSVEAVVTGDPTLVADGRSLVEISTSVISDRFGNQLSDGHLVQLQSDGPNGVGVATASTIDGIARFRMLAPSRPGIVEIAVAVDGVVGDTSELVFEPAISSIPVELDRNESGRVVVRIGPVLDNLGATVTDGTPVTATIEGSNDSTEVPLRNGRAEITLDATGTATDIDVVVEVLGVETTVTG